MQHIDLMATQAPVRVCLFFLAPVTRVGTDRCRLTDTIKHSVGAQSPQKRCSSLLTICRCFLFYSPMSLSRTRISETKTVLTAVMGVDRNDVTGIEPVLGPSPVHHEACANRLYIDK